MGAVVIFDLLGNRPAATAFNTRSFFVATDEGPTTYVSDGSGWSEVGTAANPLPSWFQYGNGSPVGTVTPDQVNAVYIDIDPATPGGTYKALGATAADWVSTGGASEETVPGLYTTNVGSPRTRLLGVANGSAELTDVLALVGTTNGAFYNIGATDGTQNFLVRLGLSGEHEVYFPSDLTGGVLEAYSSGVLYLRAAASLGVVSRPSSTEAFSADGANGATVALDGGGLPIRNILDPTNPQDAATKAYADSVAGLPSWFQYDTGSPVGVVTPAQVNAIYVDIDPATFGDVWKATGATDTDWVRVGLPTNWTQDGFGNVDTHDHNIAAGNGQITADSGAGPASVLDQSGVQTQDGAGATAELTYSGGVTSTPTGSTAFTAGGSAGATVALDGGGLLIENAVWDGGGP